jgi:cyclic pyranopterin phosphate synthase
MGVAKARLTWGEPTVRRVVGEIIACVAATPGIAKAAMTTNGWNLRRHIVIWRAGALSVR